jgi:tripartite motif-containing protein 9/67
VGQRSFTWDLNNKGPNIELINDNLTANKKSEVEYETVLGNIQINSSSSVRHYWEIKIDKFVDLDDIIIGVSQKGMDIRQRPFDTGKFWGWICTGNRKIFPSAPGGPPQAREYGGNAKIGDVLGCLLEFKSGIGHLTFLKNKVSMICLVTNVYILYAYRPH